MTLNSVKQLLNIKNFNATFILSLFYISIFALIGVYVMFLPKVLNDIGYTTTQIGIVFASMPLIRFLIPFLFINKFKLTKSLFQKAILLLLFSTFSFYFTIHNIYIFILSNFILGIAISLILPYIESYALEFLQKERYGKIRLFGSIGFMGIGLILAKFLTEPFIALHYLFLMAIFTSIFSFLIIKSENHNKYSENSDIDNNEFPILKHWQFWLAMLFMQIGFGGFYNFFTIYETSHGISLKMISYLWAFGVICEILMLFFQGPLLKKNLLKIIEFTIFITIFRWLLLFLFPDTLIISFLSQSIHAFSFALYHSAVITYLRILYTNKTLGQQFLNGIAYGLGALLGSVLSGLFYGEYLYLFSATMTFFAFITLKFMKRKIKFK